MVRIREPDVIRDYNQVVERVALVIDGDEIVPAGRLNWFDAESSHRPSDEALLTAFTDGAEWALESLYQRYSRSLYSLAYRMVANQQVAEDLLQDAFLAVWQRADTYSPQTGTVRSWLFTILHHRTIDYLRRARCQSAIQKVQLEEIAVYERCTSPDTWDEAWLSVKRSLVRAALMKIPAEQRLAIVLAYFQGWTHAEIATRMRIPLGTVKARIRLGLDHLKRVLIQMGMDET